MTSLPRRPRTTAKRIVLAFAAVLVLFGLALVVMLVSLAEIGTAEREVARLDHAKHAGHHAAAMAREQYIHQAHSLLEWNETHVAHYQAVAAEARAATAHLRMMVTGAGPIAQADQIEQLIAESDRRFRDEVLPAIRAGQRERVSDLHRRTEEPVAQVVAINGELNRTLERASDAAAARAEGIRGRARIVVVGCFALAIVLAIAVGGYLLRAISRPVAALTRGAERLGAGDLDARIGLTGDDELAGLAQAFDRMAADLAARQAALVEAGRLLSASAGRRIVVVVTDGGVAERVEAAVAAAAALAAAGLGVEVVAAGDVDAAALARAEAFAAALARYRARDFAGALAGFEAILSAASDDGPSKTYVERCRWLLDHPPDEPWDGVWHLKEK